jgi:hypothetical protein
MIHLHLISQEVTEETEKRFGQSSVVSITSCENLVRSKS